MLMLHAAELQIRLNESDTSPLKRAYVILIRALDLWSLATIGTQEIRCG